MTQDLPSAHTRREPVPADDLVRGVREVGFASRTGPRSYWVETRPDSAGPGRLMCSEGGGEARPVLPDEVRVGSGVYGYGSRPYTVTDTAIYFVGAHDQALHRWSPPNVLTRLSPASDVRTRYAAPVPAPDRDVLYAVRERDLSTGTVHDIVSITTDGGAVVEVVASGHDFYGAPAVSPDGRRIAYVAWDMPDMPWDQSILREVGPAGDVVVDGRPGVSFTQPSYSPDGVLHVIHDESGWWNLYAAGGGRWRPLAPMSSDVGRPDWGCGLSTYALLDDASAVVAARDARGDTLFRIAASGDRAVLSAPGQVVEDVAGGGVDVAVICGSPGSPADLYELSERGLRPARGGAAEPEGASMPRRLRFPTHDGSVAHALFYEPDVSVGAPPLVVACHGGPTVSFTGAYNPWVQFWTSRGFAVVEVNYRGSSGHGRAYRQAIRGRWGHLDVADAVSATRYLVAQGKVDPRRIVVRGLSSGGLTALRAAQSVPDFAVVTSLCGVVDPSSMPGATHKMESHYLDGLIAPWPAGRDEYKRRSVLADVASLRTPTLLIHGIDDPIVPHIQSSRLAEELRRVGTPVELVTYDGEGHGLKDPANVVDALQRELAFVVKHLPAAR